MRLLRCAAAVLALGSAAPGSAAAFLRPERLPVNRERVGPVTSGTRVSRYRLAEAFPGYRVNEVVARRPGERARSWRVVFRGDPILVVHSDDGAVPASVDLVSPRVPTPSGIHVGAPVDDLARKGKLRCFRGTAALASALTCDLAGAPWLSFQFDADPAEIAGTAPGAALPDGFAPRRGTGRIVRRITWWPRS